MKSGSTQELVWVSSSFNYFFYRQAHAAGCLFITDQEGWTLEETWWRWEENNQTPTSFSCDHFKTALCVNDIIFYTVWIEPLQNNSFIQMWHVWPAQDMAEHWRERKIGFGSKKGRKAAMHRSDSPVTQNPLQLPHLYNSEYEPAIQRAFLRSFFCIINQFRMSFWQDVFRFEPV